MKYFGSFNEPSNADYDGDETNILQEFLAGVDPNKIQFLISTTNDHVNGLAPVQLSINGGVPSYIAVVDGTNFTPAGATWHPYTASNILINLGLV